MDQSVWYKRFLWFVLIWIAGVLCIGILATLIRAILRI